MLVEIVRKLVVLVSGDIIAQIVVNVKMARLVIL